MALTPAHLGRSTLNALYSELPQTDPTGAIVNARLPIGKDKMPLLVHDYG